MIKSAKQYVVTKRRLADFEQAVEGFDIKTVPEGVTPSGHRAAFDALVSLRNELASQVHRYDDLIREGLQAIELNTISDLPRVLIETRIARRMTQAALADRLGVNPQQVQRWETEDYENVGLAYALEIADALRVDEILHRGRRSAIALPSGWPAEAPQKVPALGARIAPRRDVTHLVSFKKVPLISRRGKGGYSAKRALPLRDEDERISTSNSTGLVARVISFASDARFVRDH